MGHLELKKRKRCQKSSPQLLVKHVILLYNLNCELRKTSVNYINCLEELMVLELFDYMFLKKHVSMYNLHNVEISSFYRIYRLP